MEANNKVTNQFSQSYTLKGLIIGGLILLLLIPGMLIRGLIYERQQTSIEAIERINAKWSNAQTVCAPILSVPYNISRLDANGNVVTENHIWNITPDVLDIDTRLYPEERYYGIYKTILYKSEISLKGQFEKIDATHIDSNAVIYWDKAYVRIGISDLRGISNDINFVINGQSYTAKAAVSSNKLPGKELIASLGGEISGEADKPYTFECQIKLKGSSSINYIPVGKSTTVHVAGDWKDPGFIGSFSPEYTVADTGFDANWSVLSFNRSIPDSWIDNKVDSFSDTSFGVNLVNTVDHYQQNMRSAKYAIMFISLTFAVFFLVEVLTKKRIHPIQYLLVGLALIIFYSLLLSISEQINFGIAYIIASIATIGLITIYSHSIFRNFKQTGIMLFSLCLLYAFLYVILQLEDISLLIGSIGLFVILGIIMYCTRKVDWYKPAKPEDTNCPPPAPAL